MSDAGFRSIDPAAPVVFLGIADGVGYHNAGTPLEASTVFKLSLLKPHFCFPAIMRQSHWCFLVRSDVFRVGETLEVRILDDAGQQQGNVTFGGGRVPESSVESGRDPKTGPNDLSDAAQLNATSGVVALLDRGQWILRSARIHDLLLLNPGEYRLVLEHQGVSRYLGRVIVFFSPPPPLSEEEISALESDPTAPKRVNIQWGCKKCPSVIKIYAALKKLPDAEAKEHVYYEDLPPNFVCQCGATNVDLSYLKRGMLGFLRKDGHVEAGEISYIKRYAHDHLREIVSRFLGLLDKNPPEEEVQKFLEQNKVLFARFHAKKLFVKPRILGKFNADFAILDTEGAMTLVEIERPSLRLFKKNGHLRSDLNHAHEQVMDWLNEVSRHRAAVIDGFGLKADDVLSFKACVIAGRTKAERKEHLGRLMSHPRFGVEFFTFDMLAQSLGRIVDEMP